MSNFATTTIVEQSPIIVSLEIDTHGEITLPFPILADGLIIVSDEIKVIISTLFFKKS